MLARHQRVIPSEDIEQRLERAESPRYKSIPVLSDPATLGCLVALVREAWGDPHLTPHVHPDGHPRGCGWTCLDGGHEIMAVGWHPSEVEALLAALEAARREVADARTAASSGPAPLGSRTAEDTEDTEDTDTWEGA